MPDGRRQIFRKSQKLSVFPDICPWAFFCPTSAAASDQLSLRGSGFLTKYLAGSRGFSSICAGFNHVVTVRAAKSWL
jgi:hypothetical protein